MLDTIIQKNKTKQAVIDPNQVLDNDAFKIEFYHSTQPYECYIQHDTHKLILLVSLNSQLSYQSPLEELVGTIAESQYNLLYHPAKKFHIQIQSKGGEMIVIHFDLHHWLTWLPKKDELRLHMQKCILEKMGSSIFSLNQTLTNTLKQIFQDIKFCSFEEEYLKQYTYAKVLELMVILSQPISIPLNKENDLPDEEIEKMYKAKHIITKNLAESCSIITLAQQVGTNECYLKRNFKKVFGDSVYQYLLHERMEKARDLLLNTDKKVSAIAKEIGYKNASHFSVAYKKHFGILPNQER